MKPLCALMLSLLLLFTPLLAPASGAARVFGDVDGDGAADASDARLVLRASVGLEHFTGERRRMADADGDGALFAADARLILRAGVGLETLTQKQTDAALAAYKSAVVDVSGALYTYDSLCEDLALLQKLAPTRFSYRSLGKTADGREIWCAVLGTGCAARQIAVDVSIHGSEYWNVPAVMSAVEYYLRNYDRPVYNGRTMRELLDDTDLYFLPMFNPDGIAISQFGLAGLKSRALVENVEKIYQARRSAGATRDSLAVYLREWKANANGVDLNRNFLFERTGLNYKTGVYVPANEGYAGSRRQPEAEVAAYRDLINSLSNPVAVLSIHSQGGLIYWDCSQSAAGKAAAKQLASVVSGASGYYLDMSDSFVGASADWTMIEKNIPSVTVECGRGHNPLPASALAGICNALRNVFPAVAQAALAAQ